MIYVIIILRYLFVGMCLILTFGFIVWCCGWFKRNKQYMKLDKTKKKREKWDPFKDKEILDLNNKKKGENK